MAKGFVLRLGDEESVFGFTKVDREKLYGRKERIVVDENGEPCVAAYLTSDGRAVIPPGGAASLYVDAAGDTVERSELMAVDEAGEPLPLVPSTLGVAQALVGPVPPSRVLDHLTTTVYQLAPEQLGDGLKGALAAGSIFELRYNWREDYADAPAFLLQNDQGIFVLVSETLSFDFVRKEAEVSVVAEDEDAEADLDFAMM